MKKKRKNIWLGGTAILVLVIISGLILFPKSSGFDWNQIENFDGKMTIYKSPKCGCCGLYLDYIKKKTELKLNIVEMDDVSSIKDEYNVPANLRSCHISIIGDYFVEGHIPLEAIIKLMTERPDIAGIALPGMPSGSPGMPGVKKEPFIIYAVNKDGTFNEFMRL